VNSFHLEEEEARRGKEKRKEENFLPIAITAPSRSTLEELFTKVEIKVLSSLLNFTKTS
jgi:hypothetical protein